MGGGGQFRGGGAVLVLVLSILTLAVRVLCILTLTVLEVVVVGVWLVWVVLVLQLVLVVGVVGLQAVAKGEAAEREGGVGDEEEGVQGCAGRRCITGWWSVIWRSGGLGGAVGVGGVGIPVDVVIMQFFGGRWSTGVSDGLGGGICGRHG